MAMPVGGPFAHRVVEEEAAAPHRGGGHGFALADLNFVNMDPVVPVLRRMLVDIDFSRYAKTGLNYLDSPAFANVLLVSLKNVPHVFFSDTAIGQFDNAVSSRMRYLQCAVTSLAATVYHLVFGAIFTALTAVTIGKVQAIREQMRKEWAHAGIAAGATVISCTGAVNPEAGIYLNVIGIAALGRLAAGDISENIAFAYRRHAQELKQAVMQVCRDNHLNYDEEFAPFFRFWDGKFAQNLDFFALADAAFDSLSHLPGVIPIATPALLMDNLQQAANGSTS